MPPRSILDRSPLSLAEADARLTDLRRRRRDMALAGVVTAAFAPISSVWDIHLALALGCSAAVAWAAAFVHQSRLQALLGELLRDRDAYGLESVRRAGAEFASEARRHRIAALARRVVWSVDSGWLSPGVDLVSFVERVRAHKDRLLLLADNLDSPSHCVHPASLVLLHQLLTRPPWSPLYNPKLEPALLDLALRNIEIGVEDLAARRPI
jgi:hypothetical protein